MMQISNSDSNIAFLFYVGMLFFLVRSIELIFVAMIGG